jgi:mannan endo-1,4-beta-mannosidase
VAFCEWLSNKEGQPYRMPTEAEWEYTCRAGTATKFWSGNKPPPDAQAANSWGLKAMHDSVLEWGSDWHEVPPTADEPVTFRGQRGGGAVTNLANLNTVQGQLTEAQYKDLLTPGAELHQRWCAQVDAIVPFLKKLEEARVPLLWRPFHKMNGTWFWWGGRRGEYGTAAKYKMMFDRLVKHHKIKNLIWGWSVDRPEGTSLKFEECWPGPEYVDVLSLDCYREFKQPYYNDLLKVANGKPIALGEVGGNLSLAALQSQPKWT